ncbi:MAG: fasciclin domain-containing protein [Pyrinomonadaceae bacterium]
MKRLFVLAVLLIAASFPALAQNPRNDYKNINLIETLEAAGDFKTLLAALRQTGLIDTLKSPGPFTLFAPNDAAFAKLPPGALNELMKNPAELRSLLLYHVTEGKFFIKDLQNKTDKTITTMENRKAWFQCDEIGASPQSKAKLLCNDISPTPIIINRSARVVMGDLSASNGMIHVIDNMLRPAAN